MQNEELAAQRQDRINIQSLDRLSKGVVRWLQLDHLLTGFLMHAYANNSACINIHPLSYIAKYVLADSVVAGVVENWDFHSPKNERIHQKPQEWS